MERTISEAEPALVISIQTKNYEVRVYPAEKRGWFEHHIYGDERGGGLLFERATTVPLLALIDYDGVACLPREVSEALREAGVYVGEEFMP